MVLYYLSTIQDYVHGAPRKGQLMGSFVEHFNGKSWKNELSFCPADITKLDKKGTVHVLFAILAYVHDALWKWQLIASFG